MIRALLAAALLTVAACETNGQTDDFPAASDAEAARHCHEQGFPRAERWADATYVCVRSVRP